MRDRSLTWPDISYYLNCGLEQAKQFYKRHLANQTLPPKTIVKKTITTGRVGLEIKKIVSENPKTPYRKIPGILKERIGENFNTPIPSASTVEKFLLKNKLIHKVCLKKVSNYLTTGIPQCKESS
jgi:hypothetical protein